MDLAAHLEPDPALLLQPIEALMALLVAAVVAALLQLILLMRAALAGKAMQI